MGYLLSFTDYRPAPRYNQTPWTHAKLYEGPTADGPWTEIDDLPLSPPDVDPATLGPGAVGTWTNPAVRSFSTSNATEQNGLWYTITFFDAFGGLQETTAVLSLVGLPGVPDLSWVREASNVDWDELGYPDAQPDRLQSRLDQALTEFQGITGIDLAKVVASDARIPLIHNAVRMLVEYGTTSGQMEQIETASDYDMLSSMSASGYSESRRGIVRPNPQVLHPWPALNRLLNLVVNFDDQGNVRDTGPGVVASGDPRPYEDTMRQRAVAHGLHFGIGPVVGPVWPRGGGC